MPRHDVLSKVPADKLAEANAYMVGLFGEDPGTQVISLNAYEDGNDPQVATHSLSNINCSQAETNSLTSYMGVTAGCAALTFAPPGSGQDRWAAALAAWGLKPVMPGG